MFYRFKVQIWLKLVYSCYIWAGVSKSQLPFIDRVKQIIYVILLEMTDFPLRSLFPPGRTVAFPMLPYRYFHVKSSDLLHYFGT